MNRSDAPALPFSLARFSIIGAATLSLSALAPRASAQWVTEDFPLKAGWNAVWLSIDCSDRPLDDPDQVAPDTSLLVGSPDIEEVWRWNPSASTATFTDSPAGPVAGDSQWHVWRRGFPADTTLGSLTANAAYLVKVKDTVTGPYALTLKGKPRPPRYQWKSNGLNFLGFPMQPTLALPDRSLERFLSFSSALNNNPATFFYDGGELGANNPLRVTAPRTTSVKRGSAYWVQSTGYTDYYGPLQVTLSNSAGIDYGDALVTIRLNLKNTTTQAVTATLTPLASATPPAGQPAVAGIVPILLRGALNPVTGQFAYTPLTGALTKALAADESTELVFALNRSQMGNTPGAVFQSIIRVTDSLNLTQIDLPVRAVTTSLAGLWAGEVVLTKVNQIVGQTSTPADAPSEFTLRVLMHLDGAGQTRLLPQVFLGKRSGAQALATAQALLDATTLSSARRLTSASFPPGTGFYNGSGTLGLTGATSFNVVLGYNAATNPFVHTYHPDHDNLNAKFQPLPAGKESPTVSRAVTFTFQPSLPGVSEPTWGSTTVGGTYAETITGLRAQPVAISGTFVLRRVSDITALITQ